MYGWLCGIIFSKLGRSSRRVTAMKPSTTVASAISSMNSGRKLNTSRSRRLPERWSKSRTSRITGMASCLILPMSGFSLLGFEG
jgi:hypothetical protein